MKKEVWFLGILAFGIAMLLLLAPTLGAKLRNSLKVSDIEQSQNSELSAENLVLKTKIAELQSLQNTRVSTNDNNSIVIAEVYSKYPFNIKNELLINAGEKDGIQNGDTVLVPNGTSSEGILLGRVTSITSESSVVQTIFDERWQSSVKIGKDGVEALLGGGFSPSLTLIAKDATIESGDAVFNADQAFPYGLSVATIDQVGISKDQVFKEAKLNFPYSESQIQNVRVLKRHP